METRVVLVGLGPIGIEVGKAICATDGLELVAAVDVHPELVGRPVADVVPGAPKLRVERDLKTALKKADVMALCTSSRLSSIAKDIETAIASKVHVVSTCEELSAPLVEPALWKRLDARAKKGKVAVWGTGVNPGFVLDRLILQLTRACVRVDKIVAERVVDARKRRGPLRKKVGEGLSEAEFRAGVKAGKLGHVGLKESAWLVAQGLGWKTPVLTEEIEPVLGKDGKCRGIDQIVRGVIDGKERIKLQLAMFIDAPSPHDWIVIHGDPPLNVLLDGGVQGDRGTIGTVVSACKRVSQLVPGLVMAGQLV